MVDTLQRFIHRDGAFRFSLVETTQIGRDTFQRISPSPIGIQLLSQAMTGSLLLASQLKSEGVISLKFQGKGPVNFISVEANSFGETRGIIEPPGVSFDVKPGLGLFEQALGRGELVYRWRGQKTAKVHTSVVALTPGEMALNLVHYLLQSEQVPSAIQLGTSLHPEKGIHGAGGLMIQALPGADENLLFILENRLREMPPLGQIFIGGKGHAFLLEEVFGDIPLKKLEEKPVTYRCNCSRKQTFQALATLPLPELRELRGGAEPLEINCSFCEKSYTCLPEDLEVMIEMKIAAQRNQPDHEGT